MPLQNLNKNCGKTNKEYTEGMQNTQNTSKSKLLSLHISQYIKQQKQQIMAKSLELSEVRILCMLMNILKYS